ncbi:hypothetical protein KAU09_01475 [Candidatus Parcubacteria bacterium]|nr:hypothetical protein [Candidatus Parcubacteria bacterium]
MPKGGRKINKNDKEKPKKGAVSVKKIAKKSAKKAVKKKIIQRKVKLAVKMGSKADRTVNSSHVVEIEKNLNLEKEIKAEKIAHSPKTKQPGIISEKQEKDKQLIMWSGVTFFMILIIFVWAYQIRHSIGQAKLENNNQKTEEWKEVLSDLEKNINGLKTNLEKVKEFSEESDIQENQKMDDELIKKIKNNIASSSAIKASDIAASSELKINN